jgi:hypothetical protein
MTPATSTAEMIAAPRAMQCDANDVMAQPLRNESGIEGMSDLARNNRTP